MIVNPAAAGGRVGRQWARLQPRLAAAGLDIPSTFTERPSHATEIAAALVRGGADTIVAFGGDGTICEVVQGLRNAGGGVLGILPMGTGNDAARTLGIPLGLEEAVRTLLTGRPRSVDLMQLGDRVVLNAIGIGLLGAINLNAAGIKFVRGIAAYLVAAAGTLFRYKDIPIELQNGTVDYRGGMTILAIHNGPTTGGGFRLAPSAVPDDGEADVCLVGPVGVAGRLSRLGSALRGKLGSRPGSREFRFAEIELRTQTPLPCHLDGNPFWIQPPGVTVTVLPSALPVLLPPA